MAELTVIVPLRTVPGQNAREHHYVRAKRVKNERHGVAWMMKGKMLPPLPVTVTLTRCGPNTKPLDSDNLEGSLKAVRDEVAKTYGVDDGGESIAWRYEQKRQPAWEVAICICAMAQ